MVISLGIISFFPKVLLAFVYVLMISLSIFQVLLLKCIQPAVHAYLSL